MKINIASRLLAKLGLTAGTILSASEALSAPIDFATEPLFLQNNVPANILLLADDSTSMGWEVLLNSGDTGGNTSGLYIGTHAEVEITTVPTPRGPIEIENLISDDLLQLWDEMLHPTSDLEARHLCAGFNTLAYNPNRVYTPWKGVDRFNQAYTNITSLNQVLLDPFDGGFTNNRSNVNDISNHFYFEWNDANNNGEYDSSPNHECPGLPWPIGATDLRDRINHCRASSGCVYAGDLSNTVSPGQEHSPATNYGNWYTYYRNRAYVAQRALSEVVWNSQARMGLGTLHDNNNVGNPIADMSETANKADLLNSIGNIGHLGSTPLRETLYNAGNYFLEGDNTLFGNRGTVSSPIQDINGGSCQRNYTILMSDGFWNSSGPGRGIGNADGDNSSPFDNLPDTGLFGDETPNTLADVAMYFFENDLSSLPDNVPESNRINNGDINGDMHQHMVTYTVAFGVNGTIACNPEEPSCTHFCPSPSASCDIWPAPTANSPETVDDMRHAAINGRGEFLSANDPDELIISLQEAMNNINARNSSASAVAASSTTLQAETVIFQAKFNTGDWHGDLVSIPVSIGTRDQRASCSDIDAGQPCDAPPNWSAGTDIDGVNSQNHSSERNIVTYSTTATGADAAVAFRWPLNSSAPTASEINFDQIAELSANTPPGMTTDEYGQNLVNYIRGDQSNELNNDGSSSSASAIFRRRETSILGDIINSSPHFVGPPNSNYTENDYETWAETHASRPPIVYVGANDGMLHAFNADADSSSGGGDLLYSYIPGSSYPNIRNLASPTYRHQYFVDGSPISGDVYFGGSWHTVLLAGLNAGGQKIFALNITNPDNFTEDQRHINDVFLWEFEHPELGYTFSEPDIIKLNGGRWAAVFGNGYNNTDDDGLRSSTGVASLFVVDIATGEDFAHNIPTSEGSMRSPNGLATVTPVDHNGDGETDFVYGGDLEGNLWRFDLRNEDPNSWTATRVFTAISPEGEPQPITSRPSVSFHPENNRPGFVIYFGTGRYMDVTDNSTDIDTQSFYAVWDDLSTGTLPALTRGGRDYLQQTIISQEPHNMAASPSDPPNQVTLRSTSTNSIDWNTQKGWFIDLTFNGNNSGERQVTRSILRGDRIVFVTILPDSIPCNFGGSSFLMELSILDGQPASSPPLDINGDGVINSADIIPGGATPSGISFQGVVSEPIVIQDPEEDKEYKVVSSSSGSTSSIAEEPPQGGGSLEGQRTSWTELVTF